MKLAWSAMVLVIACSKTDAPPASAPPAPAPAPPPAAKPASTGWYRAVLGEQQGASVPFFLLVPESGDDVQIANGPERVHAHLVARPPHLVVAFDVLNTRIEANAGAGGVLEGSFTTSIKAFPSATLSFRAEPIAAPDPALRVPSKPGGPDPSGVWKVAFAGGDVAKLELARAASGEVTGTVDFPSGNLAFVAGGQDGAKLELSAFDGAEAYLLVAELDGKGEQLAGTWTSGPGLGSKEKLQATKTGAFAIEHVTKLVAPRPKLDLPLLARPPYRGKPVIVELGASWCPTCPHASDELRDLLAKYGAQGLQVVMLDFELTDDPVYNKAQAEKLARDTRASWQVIAIDGGPEKYGDLVPPQLAAADPAGFPITLFVARDRGIEGVHVGFPASEWGEPYRAAVAEYERLAAKIVRQ